MKKVADDKMIRLKIARELTLAIIVAELCIMTVDTRSIGSNIQSAARDKRSSQTNAADTQMQTLTLNLNLNGQIKTLTLEKNDNVPPNTPVYVIEKGRVTRWTDPDGQEVSAYINMNTFDALTMSQLPSATEFIGVFHDGIQRYSLMPARTSNTVMTNDPAPVGLGGANGPNYGVNTTYTVDISGTKHVVVRQDETTEDVIDEITAPIQPPTVFEPPNGPPMVGASGKQEYVVEYMAVIDFSIYNRWFSSSTQTTTSLKRQDALRNIRTFYAHVVNEIDMRYSTITSPTLSVNVRFVGYYVMTTPEDSSFTEGVDVLLSRNGVLYTNASKALVKFGSFVANNTQLFGNADHVGLFSDNLLTDGGQTIAGLGYIGTICDASQKVSVIHEFGQYSVTQSAAHELAHNLGSLHDGDNNNCNSVDQFIMATSPGQLTAANFNNTFRFSPCSVASIVNKLNSVPSTGIACLLNSGNEPKATIVDTDPNPGQTYTVDQQCQQLYGPQSFYCAGNTNDQMICNKMLCWDPVANRCTTTMEQRAADGTTCGNRRWCQRGQCVADSAAPPANDWCIYGDNRGYFDTNLTCTKMGQERPNMCYNEGYTGSQCCQTCATVRAAGRPGCEYGDHDTDYCAKQPISSCYGPVFYSTCCATCWRNATNNSCAYGDQNTWCTDGWQNCYDDSTRTGCCQTCTKFYTGISGCEYGDRVPWCSLYTNDMSSRCKDANFANSCCNSCAPFLIASTTSPTPPVSTVRSTTTSTKTTPASTSTTSATSVATTTTTQTSSSSTTATTTTTQYLSTSPTKTGRPATTKSTTTIVVPDNMITANHCSNVTAGRCLSPNADCCEKCSNLYTGIEGCEYGDLNTRCKEIVKGPADCQQPGIASACCKTCATYQKYECVDKAGWCSSLFTGWCYDEAVRSTCCATCSRNRRTNSCCPYGDQYEWCHKDYCWVNARECCATC